MVVVIGDCVDDVGGVPCSVVPGADVVAAAVVDTVVVVVAAAATTTTAVDTVVQALEFEMGDVTSNGSYLKH